MAVRPLDTLLAHKAINLASELSNSEKRVAGAVIDHFNRKTTQCDPSLDTIAELIGMSRRTVIRAVYRLQKFGFIRKVRHGGKFHRNRYEPVWPRFQQAEEAWIARRRERSSKFSTSKVSPCEGHTGHIAGDITGTQTLSANSSKETFAGTASLSSKSSVSLNGRKRLAMEEGRSSIGTCDRDAYHLRRSAQSGDAARDAAERRWNTDLLSRFGHEPAIYEKFVEAIDAAFMTRATDAELNRRGAGLDYLTSELFARNMASEQQREQP